MARVCESCGKGPMVGNRVSHANNRTKRRFEVNLRSVRAKQPSGGARRMRVCTGCLRSDRIEKAV